MKEDTKPSRRQFLKIGGAAIAMIPVALLSGNVMASTNAAMRAATKYRDKPNGEKRCGTCMQFNPGNTPKDLGGCKLYPGDTEISPTGYCMVWVAAKSK
ncbi:MAG: high-potential iron-sulfur protein [Thiobacillaceae bacterium]